MFMQYKKRIFIISGLVIICFIIQITLLPYISLGSIVPNFMIIVTSSIGFMRGKKEGMLTGFLCGIMIDIFFSDLLGYQGLLYLFIGYANGYFQRLFYDEDIKLPLALIASSEVVYGLGTFLLSFLLRSRFAFSYYFMHIIIPELIYTMLFTLVLYQIIRKLNHWLENEEKRSASKFV